MLTIRRFDSAQFASLRPAWTELDQGPDMTVFQSFPWYEIVNEHFRLERLSRAVVRLVYYVVFDHDARPVLIAPFRVHLLSLSRHHRRGVHFAGRNGHSDYLNFIYRDFDRAAAELVLQAVAADYRVTSFELERLLAGTAAGQWVAGRPRAAVVEHEAVQLELPAVDYPATLSKSTRQNVRTAWNRSRKDGLVLSVVWGTSPIMAAQADGFARLKRTRESNRASRANTAVGRVRNAARKLVFATLFTEFDEAREAMLRMPAPWSLKVASGGEVCAFAFGLADRFHGTRVLRVLQVAIDETFARYSPGLVGLHEFATSETAAGRPNVDVVDFTRGGERYKYDLGGRRVALLDVHFTTSDTRRRFSPRASAAQERDD